MQHNLSENAILTYCNQAADKWADWVESSRNKLAPFPGGLTRLQDELMVSMHDFSGSVNRMKSRAVYLLKIDLSPKEVRADLYFTCIVSTKQ
jgi:hypothetical protein